ncbi:MAG: M14 family metallopeptidase [Nitrososphaeria archaeon]
MKPPFSRKRGQLISTLLILIILIITITYALQSSTLIPSSGTIYYQPEAQLLFNDGYETGNFNAWTGTQTTTNDQAIVIATNAYEGNYHAQLQTNAIASGTKYAYSYITLTTPISEIYTRAYFYIVDGLPLDDNDDRFGLIAYEANNQLLCTLRVHRSSGVDKFNIIGFNGDGTVQRGTDDIYPAKGQWYCLEFYVKVHSLKGEYRAWINGVEQIAITDVNNTRYGWGVNRIRIGLTSTINVQHTVTIYCDVAAVSNKYIGPFYQFGIIGSPDENPAINNFIWLFGNQSISYKTLSPSEVRDSVDVDLFEGLVIWTKRGGYHADAIKKFAQNQIVIAHMWDFCNILYPSLSSTTRIVATSTVTYTRDWGNFRSGDSTVMRNETGNTNTLMTVLSSALSSFGNISLIAQYDSTRIAFFHMNGTKARSGFYVMDLDATTPETEWVGIWHLFPAIKMVSNFPTGKYARWMANGASWWNLDWVYNRIDALVNENDDILDKMVIGKSVQGRDIIAITIGKGSKNIIIDGCIHGNEKATAFSALRIVELLVEFYHSDSWWRSKLSNNWRIFIIPVLNPDGFAANTRENANGKDLNRQFPPGATTTEPEAWALRWLMGNYTPTVYINLHEGYYWYPNWLIYGNYESGSNKAITVNALRAANQTFVSLKHWGWFDEEGKRVWIGRVSTIAQGGVNSMAVAYASYQYGASCMLVESIVWSSSYRARQSLWALDYYCTIVLAFLQNNQRISE